MKLPKEYQIRIGGDLIGVLIIEKNFKLIWETKQNGKVKRYLLLDFLGEIFKKLRSEGLLKDILISLSRDNNKQKYITTTWTSGPCDTSH